ncbi:MAG: helix-turn-helix transcriptional regulator [Nitrospirae bacterium]|nr:helix-turn-helix transcriptional regulator [Nitrospirota bacterium]
MPVLVKTNKTKTDLPTGQAGTCEITFVNKRSVAQVKKRLKPDSTINQLSETFKVLGDTTRLKIIYALSQAELCVCDIAALFGLTESAVSHQLRILRNMRLVKYRRDGKKAYYTLDDEHIDSLFKEGLKHVEEK